MSDTSTEMSRPGDLAAAIVHAAGDPEKISSLLAEDVIWWITPAIPEAIMRSTTQGRENVLDNLRRVFGLLYDPASVRTQVHSVVSDGDTGAVRWSMSGSFADGGAFENEYSLWAEVHDGEITRVWEYTDLAHASTQKQAADDKPGV